MGREQLKEWRMWGSRGSWREWKVVEEDVQNSGGWWEKVERLENGKE